MVEKNNVKNPQNTVRISQLPAELAETYRGKLHAAAKADPDINYFKEILASGDVQTARELISYLINMEDNPWGQTEDDDKTQADIYSSTLRVLKMMKLVWQANISGDGKTPSDMDIAQMLIGVSEPKEDIETLSRLQDMLRKNRFAEGAGRIINGVKNGIRKVLTPNWQEI